MCPVNRLRNVACEMVVGMITALADQAVAVDFACVREHHTLGAFDRNVRRRVKECSARIREIDHGDDRIGRIGDCALGDAPFNVSVNATAISGDNYLSCAF